MGRACPNGTFVSSSGSETIDDCWSCLPGSYCEGTGLANVTGDCEAGYYCPGGQSQKAPLEYICPKGMSSLNESLS